MMHHTNAHGQRYSVDFAVESQLITLLKEGRRAIKKYVSSVSGRNKKAISNLFSADFSKQLAPFTRQKALDPPTT